MAWKLLINILHVKDSSIYWLDNL